MRKILKFGAEWCVNCKSLDKLLDEIPNKPEIEYIDIDNDMKSAFEYGVRGVPTMVMVNEDKEIKRMVGTKTIAELKNWIEND